MLGKVTHLVVDTSAFLKNPDLQTIGVNIYTVQNVVDEVTSKSQIRRLVVLPYELQIKEPDPVNIKFITDFSKKTGDYHSLSATDIRVMALAHQLEVDIVGSSHLRSEPQNDRDVKFTKQATENPRDMFGFYLPPKKASNGDDVPLEDELFPPLTLHVINKYLGDHSYLVNFTPSGMDLAVFKLMQSFSSEKEQSEGTETLICAESDHQFPHLARWEHHLANIAKDLAKSLPEEDQVTDADAENFIQNMMDNFFCTSASEEDVDFIGDSMEKLRLQSESGSLLGDDGFCEDDDDPQSDEDDDSGWITPSNIKDGLKKMGGETYKDTDIEVGCLTTDFAMQNVLKQVGLSVVSMDGRAIKELRTYVLRCHACFHISNNPAGASLTPGVRSHLQGASIVMGAGLKYQFCPRCGYQGTLRKVAVTVDENGKQVISVSCRKPITGRGKRYSIPLPKGGKHSNDPIICADQRVPQRHPSRLARMKTDALDPDYTAGFSPFVMRDVNSRAAVLGIHGSDLKHWLRKNPNDKKHGRRRKK